jgi:PAS domain S-box-containing protein
MSEPIETATIQIDRNGVVVGWDAAATSLFGWSALQAIGSPLIDLFGSAASEEAARRLAAIVESSDDAIISKDLNGIVTSWNLAAERMFGYSAEEMIGASIRTIIPTERQSEEDRTLAIIRSGGRVDHFETVRRRKDGSLLTISLTVSPIRKADGTIVGASKIARDMTQLKGAEAERFRLLEETAAITETLNEVGAAVASDLDRTSMVQAVADAATELTTAAFGVFAYHVVNDAGDASTLHTVSGAPGRTLSKLSMPWNTDVFDPAFKGSGVVRCDDITKDPRCSRHAPDHGDPDGLVPARSYLAVPVKARAGEVIGGLFLGHPEAGRFTEQHERLAIGIASWASVGLENAHLYRSAQEASRIKDDFLASLSHELRTPLNAILGYARIIRSGTIPQEKLDKALETIDRNAHALTQIVEDVLDVSRIVSGKMRLTVQPVDVPDAVRAAIDAVTPAADAKGIRITTALDPAASPISGDPDRLQQILWNLLTNAVKFTNRGGQVKVGLERIDSNVEITVSDTGMGITAEFIPHLFERFRQADAGTTREHRGLGLGLAIARQLTEMHGGTIDVSSGGRGLGATFRVRLPLMIVRQARSDQSRLSQRAGQPRVRLFPYDLRRVHVLVVDDDRDALSLVSDVLQTAGARVTTAASAAQALTIIHAETPDVLVADLAMPHMDGFELINHIRKSDNPKLQDLPAVALTAYARSDDRIKAARAGFHVHLAKPIEPAELAMTIASLARRFGTRSDDLAAAHASGTASVALIRPLPPP